VAKFTRSTERESGVKKEINAAELKRLLTSLRKEIGRDQRPYSREAKSVIDWTLAKIRDMQKGVIEPGSRD
jgi:hypothetical protein